MNRRKCCNKNNNNKNGHVDQSTNSQVPSSSSPDQSLIVQNNTSSPDFDMQEKQPLPNHDQLMPDNIPWDELGMTPIDHNPNISLPTMNEFENQAFSSWVMENCDMSSQFAPSMQDQDIFNNPSIVPPMKSTPSTVDPMMMTPSTVPPMMSTPSVVHPMMTPSNVSPMMTGPPHEYSYMQNLHDDGPS